MAKTLDDLASFLRSVGIAPGNDPVGAAIDSFLFVDNASVDPAVVADRIGKGKPLTGEQALTVQPALASVPALAHEADKLGKLYGLATGDLGKAEAALRDGVDGLTAALGSPADDTYDYAAAKAAREELAKAAADGGSLTRYTEAALTFGVAIAATL